MKPQPPTIQELILEGLNNSLTQPPTIQELIQLLTDEIAIHLSVIDKTDYELQKLSYKRIKQEELANAKIKKLREYQKKLTYIKKYRWIEIQFKLRRHYDKISSLFGSNKRSRNS